MANSFDGVLGRIPFMGGVLASQRFNEDTGARQTQQQVAQLGLLQAIQKQQQDAQLRDALAKGDTATLMKLPGGIDILGKLAAQQNAGITGQLHNAQLQELLRKGQIGQQEQAYKSALIPQLTQSQYKGETAPDGPTPQLFQNDAAAIAALQEAERTATPFRGDVNNPNVTRALVAGAGNAMPRGSLADMFKTEKPATPSPLGRLMAERDALPPNDPRRADYNRVIAGTQSAGGVNVNVNPNNPIPLGKTAATKVDEGLLDTSKGIMTLSAIEAQFKPEYQNIAPRISAEWSAIKDKLGVGIDQKDKAFLTEFSAYKRNAINAMNQYIKEITGAAMSEMEAVRILSGMPKVGAGIFDGDSPTEFKAKMDDAMKQTKVALARYEYIKRNGIKLTDDNGDPTVPLSRMPQIMNDRGNELEANFLKMRMPPDQVKKRVSAMLAKEFGLVQ